MRIVIKSRHLGDHPGTWVWDVTLVDPGYGRGAAETIVVGTADDWPMALTQGWTAWRFCHTSWRTTRTGRVFDAQMPSPQRTPREVTP